MKLWLRQSLHNSWLIAGFCSGVILAVFISPLLPVGVFSSISWLLVGTIIAVGSLFLGKRWVLVFIILAGCLVGGWRAQTLLADLRPYESLAGGSYVIRGTVSEDADIGRGSELVLRLSDVSIVDHDLPGMVWVSVSGASDIRRSDIVTVEGKISEGFGGFAASVYRAELLKLERPQPGDVALQVRDGFAEEVRQVVDEPQASLGIGYLVGQRRALPPELDEALKIAGLTHIVVASGYNLTILVRLARRLFVKVSKYMAMLSASSMVVAFIAVTGMSPSMSRAGLIAGLSLLAWYYGRRFHPLVLLPFAAAITLLVNPSYGWNNLGWQLSFAAFAGVLILAPLLQAYFFGDEKPGVIRQILGETVSAQLMTLPILIAAFGQFSNVALVANLLVLPLVPLAMLLTFTAGLAAWMAGPVAEIVAAPANWLLSYMVEVAMRLAAWPEAQASFQASGWLVIAIGYGLLIGLISYLAWRTRSSLREFNIVE